MVVFVEVQSQTTLLDLCGTELPQAISSRGPMKIFFRSDGTVNGRGFAARYKISPCGGTFNLSALSNYALIESPAFPAQYREELDCQYIIQTTDDYVIGLT